MRAVCDKWSMWVSGLVEETGGRAEDSGGGTGFVLGRNALCWRRGRGGWALGFSGSTICFRALVPLGGHRRHRHYPPKTPDFLSGGSKRVAAPGVAHSTKPPGRVDSFGSRIALYRLCCFWPFLFYGGQVREVFNKGQEAAKNQK